MEKVNIMFSVDNNYVQHLSATICSILENVGKNENLCFTVIYNSLNRKSKNTLNNLIKRYKSKIIFIRLDSLDLVGANLEGHISEATYYRIMIPELFPENIKKVIYLDSDILVRKDIMELWDTEIGDSVIGAIKLNEYNGYDKIDIPKDAPYFNAGVLVINLDKWREEQITRKAFEYIKRHPEKLIAHDQSILNYLLYDKWHQVDYTWNVRTQIFSLDYLNAGFDNFESFEEVKEDPSIVHFTTASKPWHYLNNHPFKKEYFYYLDKTGYEYEKYPERKLLFEKEIILFGTGEKAKTYTNMLNKYNLDVSFYIDNDKKKWNDTFLMKHINSPSLLRDIKHKSVIIIASKYVEEISEQLTDQGYILNKNYFKDLTSIANFVRNDG
ncbi:MULTISPECIES: glycosyltransferase family 8 protein [Niallia]|uniref:glycosyltransferase family 8 protein n=1 Tax=Niallia TaxID=2837506 RepID=UPI0013D8436C|nr:glycosyltransferase family 8 protein [Niallia circulans]